MWVLASVASGLIAGFYIGRTTRASTDVENARLAAQRDRKQALQTLSDVLHSVDGLTSEVDSHNTQILNAQREIGQLEVVGELKELTQAVLHQVAHVVQANQRLEDDLEYARARMEEQAEELDRTRREALTDDLSGVGNRKAFDKKLRLLTGHYKREHAPFCLVLCDLDRFKWINDTFGHQAGDRVLAELGELLRACVREGDIVTRIGGDEFAILLPHASLEVGRQVADRVHAACSKTNFGVGAEQGETAVTLSLGVAHARPGDTPDSIVARADQALYESKRRGRNQVFADEGSESLAEPAASAT